MPTMILTTEPQDKMPEEEEVVEIETTEESVSSDNTVSPPPTDNIPDSLQEEEEPIDFLALNNINTTTELIVHSFQDEVHIGEGSDEMIEEVVDSIVKLQAEVVDLQTKLKEERSKNEALENTHNILLIKMKEVGKEKDDYKAENEILKVENLELKLQNAKVLTDKIETKERENLILQQQVESLQKELRISKNKLKQASADYKKLYASYEDKILKLVQNLSIAEESVADTMAKFKEQEASKLRIEQESRLMCQRLQQEKEELLQLVIQKGHEATENQEEVQRLLKEFEATQDKIKEFSDFRFETKNVEKRLCELEVAHMEALHQIEIIKKVYNFELALQ